MRDPRYRDALLTYIDILGFKKLIEKSATDASIIPTILHILQLLKKRTSEGGRVIREKENQSPKSIFRAFNFSDLTVRATFIDTSTSYSDVLKWEFLYLSGIQVTLICDSNVLLRGGISIGQISMEPEHASNDDVLFGPALVRSYELEKEIALWPRLVIDSSVIEQARKQQESLWPEYYRMDSDGRFFIDYLFGAVKDGLLFDGEKQLSPADILKKHKDSAERMINIFSKRDVEIREKLRWLVAYHNGVVKRLQELHSKGPNRFDVFDYSPPDISDSLLISSELIQ
jgi:hypothetical protein